MPAKKNIRSAFSPTDILLLLLLAWYGLPAREVLPPLALFLALKLLLSGKSAVTRALSLVAVWSWTAYEAVYGLMQVAGLRMSNHAGFAITGSFDNPGPYGGFIAVGISVAFAYIVRYRKRFKGWYRGTMMTAALAAFVLGALVLPASMSRAGWLAFAAAALLTLVSDGRVRAWMKHHRELCAAAVAFSAVLCIGIFLLKKDSAVGRLHIWHMECRAIAERPLRGSGPGTALGAYGAAQEEYFRTHPDADEYIVQIAGCPEYAFNEYLGAGMERGIPALLLMAATAVSAVVNLRRRENSLACGMLALAVFAGSVLSVSAPNLPGIVYVTILVAVFLIVTYGSVCLFNRIIGQTESPINYHRGYILTSSALGSDRVVKLVPKLLGKIAVMDVTVSIITNALTDAQLNGENTDAQQKTFDNYMQLKRETDIKFANGDPAKSEIENVVALAHSQKLKIIALDRLELFDDNDVDVLYLSEI